MSRFSIPRIVPPTGADGALLSVIEQMNTRLRLVENEVNQITQGAYVKGSTKPYFLPMEGAVVGYKLVYKVTLDAFGNPQHSAEWVP